MAKTVSVTEARNQFSALLGWAVNNNDEVIIESRGKPRVFIVSYAEYQEFLTLREQARRKEALQS
jgi:prevent-host-death family protein